LGFVGRRNHWDKDVSTKDRRNLRVEKTELFAKVEQVLVEARHGSARVQALLGFQFAIMLIEGFEKLPESSKRIHLASLVLMALCVILLMTPAAYHRIVERGEATEHFHRVASLFVLAAMALCRLGSAETSLCSAQDLRIDSGRWVKRCGYARAFLHAVVRSDGLSKGKRRATTRLK